ncbi:MAG: (2Fe-2S)-binding protein [Gammaproteobacteria bacterium]|nr:(2Fe-2S)-binding protein [Gammaproteobacteria bacterium]
MHRLPPQPHEWVTRGTRVHFEFEGERFTALAGDTLTSALLANGQRLLGRSFKYHRPRGVLSAANHDANVLLQTATRLNLRADVEPVVSGEAYRAVNTWGGLRRDWGRALEWLAPILPVGFYYKAFFRPRWLFPFWERLIRRASGLGVVTADFPRTRRAARREFCECLVIGAGPAGLACARVLSASGIRITLVDENVRLGGSLTYAHSTDQDQQWLAQATAALGNASTLKVHTGAFAAGIYSDREVALVSAEGLITINASAIVVATGAIEQPAIFRNNDLPGVMLASGAQRLVRRYAVAPFLRGVIVAGNLDAYAAARELKAAGLTIEAVLDLDDPATRGASANELAAAGVRLAGPIKQLEAHAERAMLGRVSWTVDGIADSLACDGLLMSVGWAGATQLLHQAGARFEFAPTLNQMLPGELPTGVFAAGRVNGRYQLADRIGDGEAAAREVLSFLRGAAAAAPRPALEASARSHPRPWFEHARRKHFVDFDEDLQLHDLDVACREGFDNVELLKRYTTNGMGPSQGKHSNLNAARFLADYHGQTLGQIGATTARPFYHPVEMGTLAGRRWRPQCASALNPEHEAAGAEWMEAGQWRRPRFYRRGGEAESRLAEYRAVRERVGLIDVSTLGKFEVVGPDAARLLNLCYTGAVDKTALGMTRYILMCDHRGIIVDDGVAARLGEDHFYVTAGSSHAAASYRQLTQVAALFKLDVEIIDVTRQVAAINIAGPRARALLAGVTQQELAESAFPFLGIRETVLSGLQVRMMRVGFVGEVGYEIHLAYSEARQLWRDLVRLGQSDDLMPFGVETQRLLRLEKGHLIVGQDTDGVMHPFETPLTALVNFKKPQFLGKAALETLREHAERVLIGFESTHVDLAAPIEECHLIIDDRAVQGRVTSVGYSPGLNKTIGLAVLDRDSVARAKAFRIRLTNGAYADAHLVNTPFYDPKNARQVAA